MYIFIYMTIEQHAAAAALVSCCAPTSAVGGALGWLGWGAADRVGRDAAAATRAAVAVCCSMIIYMYINIYIYIYVIVKKVIYFIRKYDFFVREYDLS